MVVPPSVLIQVALRMLSGNGVVHAPDAALHERPEALNGVRVRAGWLPWAWLPLDTEVGRY